MGLLFTRSERRFRFEVVESCKERQVYLDEACKLTFDGGQLKSIGNVTRGSMKPEPGVAGVGTWFAFWAFLFVIIVAFFLSCIGILRRKPTQRGAHSWSSFFAILKDNRFNSLDSVNGNEDGVVQTKRNKRAKGRDKFRAAGRTFILGIADTQTIFIGAFLLSFAGSTKCSLTSYHFTVSVDQMLIALSAFVLSVALVRSYWRNPFAALLRLLLGTVSFIGVGLTLFRQLNFAPDYPPSTDRKDSAILLPVACLLESTLLENAQKVAKQAGVDIGFGSIYTWPPERIVFIPLAVAFLAAHVSVLVRYIEGKIGNDEISEQSTDKSSWREQPYLWLRGRLMEILNRCVASLKKRKVLESWSNSRAFITVVYWALVLAFPLGVSVAVWVRVFQTRNWVRKSGWIAEPNPEFNMWDAGQLTALGTIITVIMNVLTELWRRDDKETRKRKRKENEAALIGSAQQLENFSPPAPEEDDRLSLHLAQTIDEFDHRHQRRHPYMRAPSHSSIQLPPHRDLGQPYQYRTEN